jgi:hypothetical protein
MVREGDIREVDGKKVVVTWSDGRNYSYRPCKEKVEENKEIEGKDEEKIESDSEEKVESEPEAKRGKRKKV